jgi:hypothetical protein
VHEGRMKLAIICLFSVACFGQPVDGNWCEKPCSSAVPGTFEYPAPAGRGSQQMPRPAARSAQQIPIAPAQAAVTPVSAPWYGDHVSHVLQMLPNPFVLLVYVAEALLLGGLVLMYLYFLGARRRVSHSPGGAPPIIRSAQRSAHGVMR